LILRSVFLQLRSPSRCRICFIVVFSSYLTGICAPPDYDPVHLTTTWCTTWLLPCAPPDYDLVHHLIMTLYQSKYAVVIPDLIISNDYCCVPYHKNRMLHFQDDNDYEWLQKLLVKNCGKIWSSNWKNGFIEKSNGTQSTDQIRTVHGPRTQWQKMVALKHKVKAL
jgi:hypothetical protein